MTNLTTVDRNTLVLAHIPLAEKIAKWKKKKLSHVSLDELKSAAYMGLVEAASRYVPEKNDRFEAYASLRVLGAVRDYLRELAWGSRAKPLKAGEVEDLPAKTPARGDFFEGEMGTLPAVNKRVLRGYYVEEKKIREMADEMGVHQSRISQILSDSRSRLRIEWEGRKEELWPEAA